MVYLTLALVRAASSAEIAGRIIIKDLSAIIRDYAAALAITVKNSF
jgi:hypothetical protein